jgi:hypothetical protein
LATSTARSTSAAFERGKTPSVSPVAGLVVSKVSPEDASTHSPPMKFLKVLAADDDGHVRVVFVVLDHLVEQLALELPRDHAVDHPVSDCRRAPGERHLCESAAVPEDYFGEEVAARYDVSSGEEFEPAVIEATVDFLAELAGDGAALELAIGTGRIAQPLAQRGVRVAGIDLSEAMVA